MTAATLTLTDFLLARFAGDEQEARDKGADAMMGSRWKHAPENVYQELQSVVLDNARRVLATCEAHRKIVKRHGPMANDTGALHICHDEVADDVDCVELRALAAIYADHPDCRDEWKP